MADAAAPPNLMAYLFAKDVLHQSMRLGLAGAWEYDHPELLDALRLLDTQCKTLVQSFLPIGEQANDEDEDDGDTPIHHDALPDDMHLKVRLSMRGFVLDGYFRIRATTNLMKLSPQHDFVQHFMAAYRNEYGINIMDLGTKPLSWYQRIAFTTRYVQCILVPLI